MSRNVNPDLAWFSFHFQLHVMSILAISVLLFCPKMARAQDIHTKMEVMTEFLLPYYHGFTSHSEEM